MANEISVSGALTVFKPAAMTTALARAFQSGLQFNMGANVFSEGTILVPANLSGTVTGATNANPIIVTTGSTNALVTGDNVTITGVVGNTNANGTFAVTVLSPTTFQLPVAGNAPYLSGGSWTTANGMAVPLGQVTQPHWAFFRNLDPTNYVQLKNGQAGATFSRMLAGEFLLGPLEPVTNVPWALAGFASCLMEFLILGL